MSVLGLPKINIGFFAKLKEKVKRNPAGVVALVLKDEEISTGFYEYKANDNIDDDWSADNKDYIEQAFIGSPKKVMIVNTDEEDIADALSKFKRKRFNYLAIPEIEPDETDVVEEWIKDKRKKNRKMFKTVLPNTEADHESVINFTAEEIETDANIYDTSEYTPRIAGALAGLPFNRSATYLILDEVRGVKEVEDPDEAIDDGELILIDDGENVKIGRGVNSLQSINEENSDENKSEEFKSIRVVEIMDMIHDEIHDNFEENYIGKVPNTYDNQVLFVNDTNRGLKELEADDLQLLSPEHENFVQVDVDAQRTAWEDEGEDAEDWDDDDVKELPIRRNVFLSGRVRIVDTIEDLDLKIQI